MFFLVAVILVAGYNLLCSKENKMSDLVLANVEALAEDETATPPCVDYGTGCLDGEYWFPYMRENWWI
ncbi:NVEALA domain-containing protein [Bacteroides sp.]|uniref:NVEALA domain-containing protein n=2 Tax=Bacteroides TaxID=816 RepID=UPI0026158D21|nr:NVEALA domain-containing protein [Bacteroides sp.]